MTMLSWVTMSHSHHNTFLSICRMLNFKIFSWLIWLSHENDVHIQLKWNAFIQSNLYLGLWARTKTSIKTTANQVKTEISVPVTQENSVWGHVARYSKRLQHKHQAESWHKGPEEPAPSLDWVKNWPGFPQRCNIRWSLKKNKTHF